MKRKPFALEWNGSVDLPARIVGERTHDGEHQCVKLLVRIDKDGPEVEVPLKFIPEWIHEVLVEQFEREAA